MSTGVRFMGKDPQGNAKPIKTDEQGNIGVQLTGNIKVLREYVNVPFTSLELSNRTAQFGQTQRGSGNSVIYLNTSDFPHVDILVVNNTNVDLTFGARIFPYNSSETSSPVGFAGGNPGRLQILDSEVFESGSKKWIRSIEEPKLNRVPNIAISLQHPSNITQAEITGTVTVLFIGSKI